MEKAKLTTHSTHDSNIYNINSIGKNDYANIPDQLKKRDQWILWKFGKVKPNGKRDKIPKFYDKTSIDAHDSSKWLSFQDVVKAKGKYNLDGIGFVLTESDKIVGIDIDDCIKEGHLNDLANEIVNNCESYTEISPSGKGLRIFIQGERSKQHKNKNSDLGLEVYDDKRFLTVTGNVLGEMKGVRPNQDALDKICDKYLTQEVSENLPPEEEPVKLSDKQILDLMDKARNTDQMWELWTNESLKNDSEADFQLCCFIGFYTQDLVQVERLFNRSERAQREKWRTRSDYREQTIKNALDSLTRTYQPGTDPEIDEDIIKKRIDEILNTDDVLPEFDTSKLPPLVKEYIESICSISHVSPIIPLMSFSSCVSSMIRHKVFLPEINPATDERQYFQDLHPNLWQLVISDSGTFKTTMLKQGSKLFEKRDYQVYEQIQELLFANDNNDEDDDKKPEPSGNREAEILDLKKKLLLLPNKITMEALISRLANTGGGVFLLSELKTWTDNLEKQYATGFKSMVTDAFDVINPISSETIGRGEERVQNPYLSIGSVSTTEWVQNSITKDDVFSGFFARFLLFCPPKKQGMPPALPEKAKSVDGALNQAIEDKLEVLDADSFKKEFVLCPNSKMVFDGYYRSMYKKLQEMDNHDRQIVEPFFKRWSPYILKLAMIFQLFIDETVDQLSTAALEAAHSVVQYAVESTIWLLKEKLSGNYVQDNANKIYRYIANRGGQIHWKSLLQSKVINGGTKAYNTCVQYLDETSKIGIKKGEKKAENLLFLI